MNNESTIQTETVINKINGDSRLATQVNSLLRDTDEEKGIPAIKEYVERLVIFPDSIKHVDWSAVYKTLVG